MVVCIKTLQTSENVAAAAYESTAASALIANVSLGLLKPCSPYSGHRLGSASLYQVGIYTRWLLMKRQRRKPDFFLPPELHKSKS